MFPEWEDEVAATWMQPDPYTAAQMQIAAEREAYYADKAKQNNTTDEFDDPATSKHSLDDLKNGLPKGVNP